MTRRKRILASALLFTASLSATVLVLSTVEAQIIIDPEPICPCCWPPVPRDIVNVDSDQTSPIVVPDGGVTPASIYTVPAGKHLVVTNFEVRIRPSIMGVYPFAQNTPLQLVEDLGGAITVKRGAVFTGNHNGAFPGPNTGISSNLVSPNGANGYRTSGVGLVFAPGSNLRLAIRDPNSIDSSPGAVVVVDFTLTGYLR